MWTYSEPEPEPLFLLNVPNKEWAFFRQEEGGRGGVYFRVETSIKIFGFLFWRDTVTEFFCCIQEYHSYLNITIWTAQIKSHSRAEHLPAICLMLIPCVAELDSGGISHISSEISQLLRRMLEMLYTGPQTAFTNVIITKLINCHKLAVSGLK